MTEHDRACDAPEGYGCAPRCECPCHDTDDEETEA